MKTTLRGLALAALFAAGGAVFCLRPAALTGRVFRSPGQETATPPAGGHTVRGRVLDGGSAVAGARVRLIPLRPRRSDVFITAPVTIQAVTDGEGRFELQGVPEGPARLAVIPARQAPTATSIDVSSDSEVTIAVDAGAAIDGLVMSDGAPVAGARV